MSRNDNSHSHTAQFLTFTDAAMLDVVDAGETSQSINDFITVIIVL